MGLGVKTRHFMAKRAAMEIKSGMTVNLGIGLPSLVPNHLPASLNMMFQAENGIIGIGPSPQKGDEDANLCNAGGLPITVIEGASFFDSTTAFAMIRRGQIDMTILGALQVSQKGDLANWIVPGKKIPGMGGAMELAQKAKTVVVLMSHTDKQGNPKIVKTCSLPLTASKCVDLIITEMGVFRVIKNGLELIELFSPYTVNEVYEKTDCPFSLSQNLQTIINE